MKNDDFKDDFDSNDAENLQLENELLKLKIRAEFGGAKFSDNRIPLAMENFFLKNIIAVEQAFSQEKEIKIFEKIGRPDFKAAETLSAVEIRTEFIRLEALLNKNSIFLNFPERQSDFERYRFVTEKFFEHYIEDVDLPGLVLHFHFEEFDSDDELGSIE